MAGSGLRGLSQRRSPSLRLSKVMRRTVVAWKLVDIDKEGYPDSLDVIAAKLRQGGVLIADNLLWHGRIFDPEDHSEATKGVQELTNRITRDPNWLCSLLPMRDGVMLALRR